MNARTIVGQVFVVEQYWLDWVLAVPFLILGLALPTEVIKPYQRYITQDNDDYSYPHQHNTVPSWVPALMYPLAIVAISLAQIYIRSFRDWHHASLSIVQTAGLSMNFKRWMNLQGRLRPDWFSRQSLDDEGEIAKGRLSYPSGHTAYSWGALTLLTLYLFGKCGIYARQRRGSYPIFLLGMAAIGLATYIGVSRVFDYRHHYSDINAGAAVGAASAILSYFLNYPSLFDHKSHLPRQREISKSRQYDLEDQHT